MKGKAILQLAILLVLAVIAGCSTQQKPANLSEVTNELFLLSLSTDKPVYKKGEPVFITTYVENLTQETQRYEYSVIGPIEIYVGKPYDPEFGYFFFDAQGQPATGAIILLAYVGTLEPGSRVTRMVSWDQRIPKSYDISTFTMPVWVQAPPGTYKVSAVFANPYPEHLTTSIVLRIID